MDDGLHTNVINIEYLRFFLMLMPPRYSCCLRYAAADYAIDISLTALRYGYAMPPPPRHVYASRRYAGLQI